MVDLDDEARVDELAHNAEIVHLSRTGEHFTDDQRRGCRIFASCYLARQDVELERAGLHGPYPGADG